MKKIKPSTIIGILILLLSVLAGLFLINTDQEFRERADVRKTEQFLVCHTGVGGTWGQIQVEIDDLDTHLNHGDIFGECPK